MKKNNPSSDQLNKSLERRVRHLMIQTLEKFEQVFSQQDNTREGQVFKSDLRTMFNDVIRAQRDEIQDYEVDYRPLRINNDGVLAMTYSFMQNVQKIEFDFSDNVPFIKIYANQENAKVLDAVRLELGVGVMFLHENSLVLQIVGTKSCSESVLPLLDRYGLHDAVRAKYMIWRDRVVKNYIGDRNG